MSWFGDNDSSWDPGNWGDIRDVPIIGDIHKGLWGDPDSVKAAYDAQIQASKDAQQQMQQFLMRQKGQAQGIYMPIQNMFKSSYGTQGLQAPQIPGAPGVGPIQSMYGGRK